MWFFYFLVFMNNENPFTENVFGKFMDMIERSVTVLVFTIPTFNLLPFITTHYP